MPTPPTPNEDARLHVGLRCRKRFARRAGAVAGGRAKQRRLAQALLDQPGVLRNGRSPAPVVVGQLLIALRAGGVTTVAAPCCAGCGKDLAALARRGQDWVCRGCRSPRTPSAGCGRVRRIADRDRQGRPVCERCRPTRDENACLRDLLAVITATDPGIPADAASAAVRAAVLRPGQLHPLAQAVIDRPDLLTGAGAAAPVPAVLRLIDALCRAGATRIHQPPCPRCGRLVTLVERWEGVRICRGCVGRARAEPCVRCGVSRSPSTRDEQGRPVCSYCFAIDPANVQTCIGCARPQRVYARTSDGPICQNCRARPRATCGICGRVGCCEISRVTGQRWCRACQDSRRRCAGCGQVKPVCSGTTDQPLCDTCTQPDPDFWKRCPHCGTPGKLTTDPCTDCALQQQLHHLLANGSDTVRPELQPLVDYMLSGERPDSTRTWLHRQPRARRLLADLGSGKLPLSHEALDQLAPDKCVEHLRAVLVAAMVLPARDEHLARLEAWLNTAIAGVGDSADRRLLRRYTIWHHLRRLRRRAAAGGVTYEQSQTLRHRTQAAIDFLAVLAAHDRTLATCRQADLDQWLTDNQVPEPGALGTFIRWAKSRKLTTLDLPAQRWQGPKGPVDQDQRWGIARRLLHDASLHSADRVAGLLVVLYAQTAGHVSRLTVDHLIAEDGHVRIRLGATPVDLPEPLATLARGLIADRPATGQAASPWLFPGRPPNRPISASQLLRRLARLGIYTQPARTAALCQLATELPAAVLARTLGIDISTAVRWQRAAAGDWTAYAAEVSRRSELSIGHDPVLALPPIDN